ncbi:hypothetical protein SAMN05444340_1374 [Citreimonas salinaria]|uniref:Uncharacterized protein n=2 Tax=Citreimonas salinaria TaxID=321339 RepID=A0A1H3NZT8_9RHOB|nr:hypothetical protein SAMN05444340_1374 [Citreimonas salinaria]
MSDPVPNDETDGVLSSIRRLVAEKPVSAHPDSADGAGADAAPRPARFVLTDALRVNETAEPPAQLHSMIWEDCASGRGDAVAQPDTQSDGPPPLAAPVVLTGPTFAAPDESCKPPESLALDEDALRRLVAEVVRAELQGALGDRITQSVRKLVRREIHRALLGRDFD